MNLNSKAARKRNLDLKLLDPVLPRDRHTPWVHVWERPDYKPVPLGLLGISFWIGVGVVAGSLLTWWLS